MRTICVTTLSAMLLTAFCGGAFGAEHCRPTGELQEKLAKGNDASANSVADSAERAEKCAWFKDARFGMFIHWGIYSIPGKGEWSYAVDKYAPGEYEANAKMFNPTNYNPREWAKLAKAAARWC